jgi:hypothetical protein
MVAALPFVALASTVIGTGVSIMGSMQQASAAEASLNTKRRSLGIIR